MTRAAPDAAWYSRGVVKPASTNARRSRRLHHELPVTYRSAGRFLSDWATNISQGGMFINSRAPLPVGTIVSLVFQLPGATFPCDLAGRVTRVVRSGDGGASAPGMAIEFTDADREKRERIESFVQTLRSALDPG